MTRLQCKNVTRSDQGCKKASKDISEAKHRLNRHHQRHQQPHVLPLKLNSTESRRRFGRRGSKTAAMLIRDSCGYKATTNDMPNNAVWASDSDPSQSEYPTQAKTNDVVEHQQLTQTSSVLQRPSATRTPEDLFDTELSIMATITPVTSSQRLIQPLDVAAIGHSLQQIMISPPSSRGCLHCEGQSTTSPQQQNSHSSSLSLPLSLAKADVNNR